MTFPHASAAAGRLEVSASTGSTNADLLAHADDAENWPHLSVIVTRDQRAGRGRLDRQWVAPAGSALAVSVLLRAGEVPVAERGWIPLAAGAAMADAIAAQLPHVEVAVKWPNDVLVRGADDAERKICGILAEARGADVVVVGTGINTAMTAEQLPVSTATSFAVEGVECDEDLLVAGYLVRLDAHLTGLVEHGSAVASGLRDVVAVRCSTIGRTVRVQLPGGSELVGAATGLAADGCLVVRDADGEHPVAAGDVVHVRPA
ncbi:biotin--[acetyl-CoA-carboxylase] ligase [Microbacterium pseudoresistens]|uniref:biotin--[biotin carboxyl-carrier protein] ligase n=1 Tax=Microbacterium pseudoresistens TaxID=640634 RepID=A0A7Y9EVW3_9MICO|nr:biotin--[acetyl-CoA-carboxylase] ligase [Microbacterium pseudoresistens]NYD54932.1 BirA family biotin operon repressor/biotin-[acetyl-CoA-carboxylase] ligase [Microbacterium pseudoresistens]